MKDLIRAIILFIVAISLYSCKEPPKIQWSINPMTQFIFIKITNYQGEDLINL